MARVNGLIVCFAALFAANLVGCGGGDQPEETAKTELPEVNPGEAGSGIKPEDGKKSEAITASIKPPGQQTEPAELQPSIAPDPDTAEWFVFAIKHYPRPTDTEPSPLGIKPPADLASRDQAMIQYAQKAIGLTFKDKEKQELFSEAAHLLLEARYRLALRGKSEDVDLLYEDANELASRFPATPVAADATYILARFAHKSANDFGKEEPRWLDEFARQSRLFASEFPDETIRAPRLLFYAGWSCELHGKVDVAKGCYADLIRTFPKSREGQQATAMLRRLNLLGQPLQFGGPTIDGGWVSAEDTNGKVTLIVFWSSENERFLKSLPTFKAISEKYFKYGFRVVGVCLDEDEAVLNGFLDKQALTWPQVFDPAHRRFDNTIVKHYGIRDIPTVWLIDHKGIVRDLFVDAEKLEPQVQQLLRNAQGG